MDGENDTLSNIKSRFMSLEKFWKFYETRMRTEKNVWRKEII